MGVFPKFPAGGLQERSSLLNELNCHYKRVMVTFCCQEATELSIKKTGIAWMKILEMEEQTFKSHMRVSKEEFQYFCRKLREQGLHENHPKGGPEKIRLEQKVLIFLWYLSNQNFFREISDKFNVSQGTAHNVVIEMLDNTCALTQQFITWPSECQKIAQAVLFQRMCGIDGIVGAIDGCHIRIQRPSVRGGDYLNRKAYYSVLLQGIVDDLGRFTDIFAGPPGRVHDAQMLRV